MRADQASYSYGISDSDENVSINVNTFDENSQNEFSTADDSCNERAGVLENKAADLDTLRRAATAAKMSDAVADAMISTYYPVKGMSTEDYATAFAMATIYGRSGANKKDVYADDYVSRLPREVADAAVQYIEQLLRDLNGGIRRDGATDMMDKGISLFKKAAVMGSLSVIIQQPSAIVRAFAIVDPKYFKGLRVKDSKAAYEEIKKYAPVAIIKEMGGFDTGVGFRNNFMAGRSI